MATTAKLFGNALLTLVNKEWDFNTDTIKCALLTSSASPDQDTWDYLDDVTNECAGGSYARQTLTGTTVGYTAGTNTVKLDADDVTFAGITQADIRHAVFYVDTGGADSTDPLICWMDFGATQSVSGADFVIQLAAAGLVTLTAA